MDKVKTWLKKNWKLVAGGIGAAGLAISGVYFANNWMDILKTDWRIQNLDGDIEREHLSVYESLTIGKATAYIANRIEKEKLIDQAKLDEIYKDWTNENPEEDNLLWKIGFWTKSKEEA